MSIFALVAAIIFGLLAWDTHTLLPLGLFFLSIACFSWPDKWPWSK